MIATSRPLRFLVLAVGGWVGVRAMMLWPGGDPAQTLVDALAPPVAAEARSIKPGFPALSPAAVVARWAPTEAAPRDRDYVADRAGRFVPVGEASLVPRSEMTAGLAPLAIPHTQEPPLAGSPVVSNAPATPSRFAGSAWLIVRGGGGASPFVPQLGGSQAGIRLTYALDDARRLSLAGRVSAALGSRQREAAVGIDWQPTRLPVHIVAEQRIGIERTRGGPSVGIIAGLPTTSVAAGFTLDGYAQAGVIARDGGEGYADGSLRLARTMTSIGHTRVELGLGAWGAAQRGASRFDVGPAASLVVPITSRAVRISAEWRARVGGNARPATGPALSIGTDF